jgi:GNAT superfamily N-acetyltransferase
MRTTLYLALLGVKRVGTSRLNCSVPTGDESREHLHDVLIRPLDRERDAVGVVGLQHEVFPFGTTSVESWLQQEASIPPRARHAAWVAVEDGAVVGRAEATLKWFSHSGSAYAGVSVREAYRRRGIGARLWDVVERHLDELAAPHVTATFVESPAGAAFARARGFAEERAETLSFVDPATIAPAAEDPSVQIVPLRDVAPEEVYEVDIVTTDDVPVTDAVDRVPYEEWLDMVWRRPNITRDGSFGALVDGRLASFTLLAASAERGRAFTEFTATHPDFRRRGLAEQVKRASLCWAAAKGIRAAWTTNDETNAPMLALNERLGYETRLRRVEYLR